MSAKLFNKGTVADFLDLLIRRRVVRIAVFFVAASVYNSAIVYVPPTPFNWLLLSAAILPGIVLMAVGRDWAHWYRWVLVWFLSQFIVPAMSLALLVFGQTWICSRMLMEKTGALTEVTDLTVKSPHQSRGDKSSRTAAKAGR